MSLSRSLFHSSGRQATAALSALAVLLSAPALAQTPLEARFENDAEGCTWLHYSTSRGWHYRVESNTDLAQLFVPEPGGYFYESRTAPANGDPLEQRFFVSPPPPPMAAGTPDPRTWRSYSFGIAVDPSDSIQTRLRINRRLRSQQEPPEAAWLVQTQETFPWRYGLALLQWADSQHRYQLLCNVHPAPGSELFDSEPGPAPPP